MSYLYECFMAVRPYSLTAALIPILVTAAISKSPILSFNTIRALLMGISVQCGANLSNTYFDFVNGVDTKDGSGEKTLVENKISTTTAVIMSVLFYLIGLGVVFPLLIESDGYELFSIIVFGFSLAFFYTAKPVGLKYIALGDITIFLCFGPLIMQATSILLTKSMNSSLYPYTIPIGLLTEAILHANNARDIKADVLAGAFTLASSIGFQNSLYFYIFLISGSYIAALYITFYCHWGCALVYLTIPIAIDAIKRFKEKKMEDLPVDTAKLHLPFGILLYLGIRFTSNGIL